MLFGTLNDKFVAGLLGLIPVHLPRPHYSHCARISSGVAVAAVCTNFEHLAYISQGSVVARLKCSEAQRFANFPQRVSDCQ